MSTSETPPEPKKEWYVIVSGSKEGPFSIWDLAHRAQSGSLPAGAIAWREGMPDWLPIAMIPELKSVVQKGSPISDLKDAATRALGGTALSPETQALLQAGKDAGKKLAAAGAGEFSILFDLSFRKFMMLRAVKFIYIIGILFIALLCIGPLLVMASTMRESGEVAATFLVGIPFSILFFFPLLTILRLLLETIVALFRIAENTTLIATAVCQKPPSEGQG